MANAAVADAEIVELILSANDTGPLGISFQHETMEDEGPDSCWIIAKVRDDGLALARPEWVMN